MQTEIVSKNDAAQSESTTAKRRLNPATDVFENETELYLVVDLPGVSPDALDLTLTNDTLRLSAPRADNPSVVYERTFTLGSGVDMDAIEAELSAGLLHLHVSKKEQLKPRRIAVRAA